MDLNLKILDNEIYLEPKKVGKGLWGFIIRDEIFGIKVNVFFQSRETFQYWKLQNIMESLKTSMAKLNYKE